ncbi:MAG: FHA domain-containing protein [Planctomycetes bacterium]|nr:FHA domain-containing protein [Planctomycetota bacterium]
MTGPKSKPPRRESHREAALFGSEIGGARFELARAEAPGESPFVVLHSGRFSQVLRARLVSDRIGITEDFAVKILRQDYAAWEADNQLTNIDVEAMWDREAADLQAAASPHLIRMLDMPDEVRRSRPVVLCQEVGSYFHPPCPETGAPLTVCRDDELLAAHGLPEYSRSLVRYLHSPAAAPEDGGARIFYRLPGTVRETPRGNVEVRIGKQLFRDYGPALRQGKLPDAVLPCQGCEHRAECFPADAGPNDAIPAETRLVPVSYYDFRVLPLELLDVSFDDYADWLGGAPWSELGRRRAAAARTPTHSRLDALHEASPPPPEWLFGDDPARLWAEVLKLKLTAFAELGRGLQAVHERTGHPHLGVAPQNAMASLAVGGSATPPRWNATVRVIDLGAANGRAAPAMPGIPVPPPLLEPAGELRGTPYDSRHLSRSNGLVARLNVRVEQRSEVDGARRATLGIDLDRDVRGFRPGDVLRIAPTGGSAPFWAELSEVAPGHVVAFADFPVEHDVPELTKGRVVEATCTFRKVFGSGADLFGLGMVLFRLLLVNDRADIHRVHAAVEQCLRKIEIAPRLDAARFAELVLGKLREHAELFDRRAVLYRQEHRTAEVGGLDDSLWRDLLVFAFRLVTFVPGVSFVDSHQETHPHRPGTLMTTLLAEFEGFRQRVDAELFGGDRAVQLLAACQRARLRAESMLLENLEHGRGDGAADAAGGSPPAATDHGFEGESPTAPPFAGASTGLHLRITREGEPPIERTFLQGQITIGRKDGNTLVLKHDHVSGHHAILERVNDDYVVIDRGSTNGTFLNYDQRVDGSLLVRSGDSIVIGPFVLEVSFHDAGGGTIAAIAHAPRRRLIDDLLQCYAENLREPVARRDERLDACLAEALRNAAPSDRLKQLEAVAERLEPLVPGRGGTGAAAPAGADPVLTAAAQLELKNLAQYLGLADQIGTPEGIGHFARNVRHFLETTLDYVLRTQKVGRAANKELEVDLTAMFRREKSAVDEASSVAELAPLLLSGEATANLKRVLDDFTTMQMGLVKGSHKAVRSVMDRLEPERLQREAEQESSVGGGFFGIFSRTGNDVGESPLWKRFCAVYAELSRRCEQDTLGCLRDGIRQAHREGQAPAANEGQE